MAEPGPGTDQRERFARRAAHLLAITFLLLALAFAAAARLLGDSFFLRLATEALILSGLAMSVDLLLGCVGMLSLGQALYFGIGAYTSGLVLKTVVPSFWAALGAALAVGALAGLVGGLIAIRARGVYFALITFGLAQVVSKIVYNTRELGSSDGIIGIPVVRAPFGLFSVDTADPAGFFLLVLGFMLLAYVALSYVMRTPFGRLLLAIKANESRVPFLGFSPQRHKLAAFVLAAALAALAGAFYPMLRGFVSPELMFFEASGNAVITTIVGGAGTLIGPLYGAVLLTGVKSVAGTFTEHHLIVIGGLFMLSVIFFPKGLIGYALPRLERRLRGRA